MFANPADKTFEFCPKSANLAFQAGNKQGLLWNSLYPQISKKVTGSLGTIQKINNEGQGISKVEDFLC